MGKQMTNREKAAIYAIIGGILMLIVGVTGAGAWQTIGELVESFIENDSLNIVFQVLVLIGGLGGLIVILGGLLIKSKKDNVKFGKLLITLGAGFGLIGLIILVVLTVLGDNPGSELYGVLGIGFIGLIFSIAARQKAE